MITLADTDKFCKSCGGPIHDKANAQQSATRCPNCGAEAKSGWKVCTRCGAQLQAAQHQAAQSQVASQSSSVICRVCGRSNRAGVKFCEGCGQMIESQTAGGAASQATSAPGTQMAPVPPDTEATRRSIYDSSSPAPGMQAQPMPAQCGRCGVMMRAGLAFCEACGAPAGYVEQAGPPKSYKWVFISIIAFVLLGGAAVGWYFWGVRVTLKVTMPDGQPLAAKVRIDDNDALETDSNGQLIISHVLRGEHRIVVEKTGYDRKEDKFSLALADFSKEVAVTIEPKAYALTVRSTPFDCEVLIDNESKGKTDAARGELKLDKVAWGKHQLVVRRDGYLDFTQDLDMTKEPASPIRAELIFKAAGKWSGTFTSVPAPATVGPTGAGTSLPSSFILDLRPMGEPTSQRAEFRGEMRDTPSALPYDVSGSVNSKEGTITIRITRGIDTITLEGRNLDNPNALSGRWTGAGSSGLWNLTRNR